MILPLTNEQWRWMRRSCRRIANAWDDTEAREIAERITELEPREDAPMRGTLVCGVRWADHEPEPFVGVIVFIREGAWHTGDDEWTVIDQLGNVDSYGACDLIVIDYERVDDLLAGIKEKHTP